MSLFVWIHWAIEVKDANRHISMWMARTGCLTEGSQHVWRIGTSLNRLAGIVALPYALGVYGHVLANSVAPQYIEQITLLSNLL